MRYHNISKDDLLNGEGLRVVLWVSGCAHRCKKCQNPITWDENDGLIFDDSAKNEIFSQLEKPYIEGITFSGGDPLFIGNRKDVMRLIGEIREKYPDKNIWLYTGYEWDSVLKMFNKNELSQIDVLVDGPYIDELKDEKLMWRGSINQKVISVKESIKENKKVLYCGDYE